MAERITIAELNIDESALVRSTQAIREQIDSLRLSQRQLDRSTEEGRTQFVRNEATIRSLNTEYRNNQRALNQRITVTQDATVREEQLNQVLGREVTTITEAREQTQVLTRLRNETNATTEEGAELIARLNQQINSNTEFTRENGDAFLQNRLNVGNYTQSVRDAFEEIEASRTVLREQSQSLQDLRDETEEGSQQWNFYNQQITQVNIEIRSLSDSLGEINEEAVSTSAASQLLSGNFTGLAETSASAGGAMGLLTAGLNTARAAVIRFTQSTLAFLATPIGVVVALIAGAFVLVQNALSRSEEATNRLSGAFAGISGILNAVLRALEPLGNILIDGIVAGFELAASAAEAWLDTAARVASFLGFDSVAESINSFGDSLERAAEEGRRLAAAENQLAAAQRRSQVIQLEYQRTAETLRQTRDNDVLSIRERIAANDELGRVLERQLAEELRIANLALEVANLRIQAEGRTQATLDQQAEALTQIADIQERITGQESEQLTNRNSLLRDAANLLTARLEQEQEAFRLERQLIDENAQDRLDTERQASQRQLELLETQLRNRLITREQFNVGRLNIAIALRDALQAVEDEEEEQREARLERERAFEGRRDQLLNEIRLAREEAGQAREELRVQQEFEANVAELERLEITETERTELLALLTEQRGQVLQDIRNRLAEESLSAFQDTLDEENSARQAAGDASVAIQSQIASALVGILGDSLGARLAGIAIEAALQVAQVQSTAAAASATNLAQATAAAPPPFNLPFIATALGQNAGIEANAGIQTSRIVAAAAVQGLTSSLSSLRFEKGGIVGIDGARHAQGGVPIFAGNQYVGEAEGGEGIGILNRAAYSDFMNYNNSFNGGNSGNGKFQGGGIITQAVAPINSTDDMVAGIAQSLQEMQVFVAVEDINTGQQNFAQIENEANLG